MYFNPDAQKDLEQVVERSFRPTTEILLDLLKDGLKCAFSISGMVVDQLERWDPGMLDLLTEAATQPGVELLAQTYYHSVAGLFKDQREFRDEILLHRDLMHERFGSTPTLFAHTEYPLTPVTASTLADTGMEAAIIEGNGGVVQESDQNVPLTCQGLPVLITHCELSDDIAVRFPRREWDRWPLMADRFASWVAASPGECVTLFLDYRIFGDTIGKETGIFDFLRALPTAFSDAGVETEHPSAAARLPSRGELIVEEEHARSAGPIGATDGQRTILQQSALDALGDAGYLVTDRQTWHYLLDTNHLRRMAMRSGACGRPYYAISHQATYEYFSSFMSTLSHLEERSASRLRARKAAYSLRCLPPEKAFHFSSYNRPLGYAAYSLQELANMLEYVPESVVRYHCEREDFARWIDKVVGDQKLAGQVQEVQTRTEMQSIIQARINKLWKRLR